MAFGEPAVFRIVIDDPAAGRTAPGAPAQIPPNPTAHTIPAPPPAPPPPNPPPAPPRTVPTPAAPAQHGPGHPTDDPVRYLLSLPKSFGFTRAKLGGLDPETVRKMAEGLGYQPPRPPPTGGGHGPLAVTITNWPDAVTNPPPAAGTYGFADPEGKYGPRRAGLYGPGGLVQTDRDRRPPPPAEPPDAKLPSWIDPATMRPKAGLPGGADAPLPSWLNPDQLAEAMKRPPAGAEAGWSGRPVASPTPPPGKPTADLLKSLVPEKVGSALGEFGVDVAGTAETLGGAAAATGLEALAMAAGPAAAALVLVDVAARFQAGVLNAATKGVQAMGTAAADAAGNRYLGMFTDAATGAADVLEKIPIVGRVYAAEIRLATAATTAYAKVTEAFVARGRELARYDAGLAGAQARANVRGIQADVRESQALGPALTKLTDNQSQAEANLRELFLPIKEILAELLAEVSGVVKEATGAAKKFAPVLRFFLQLATAVPMTALKMFVKVIELLGQVLEWVMKKFGIESPSEPAEGELNSMMQALFTSLDRIPNPAAQGRAAAPGMAPLFGGA